MRVHFVSTAFLTSHIRCNRYPYISRLICNAGLATYSHLDYWIFFRQVFENPLDAVRHPMFNVQKSGAMSQDNLGHVWQCNVFGHYVMVSDAIYHYVCDIVSAIPTTQVCFTWLNCLGKSKRG